MRKLLLLFLCLFNLLCFSQKGVVRNKSYWSDKEYNKDVALFNSKEFLFSVILEVEEQPVKFEVIPLASASSGELTTLLYKCESKNKEGLILGFYGQTTDKDGNSLLGYSFRNFNKESAIEFLNKIQNVMNDNKSFLSDNTDNNNVVFKYEDVDVLIFFNDTSGLEIRLFWEGYDSTWEKTAFSRSKKRFEKKIK